MDEGWFVGCEAGDAAGGARWIGDGSAETPREWATLAVEAGFAESEGEYYDALGAATRRTAREAVTERERADDKQLVHAMRAMDDRAR